MRRVEPVKLHTDDELRRYRHERGYILNVDSALIVTILHRTSCRYCNPDRNRGIKVETKIENHRGDTYYFSARTQATTIIEQLTREGYRHVDCSFCRPQDTR